MKASSSNAQIFWEARAPLRADFGAVAKIFSETAKVRDRGGAIASPPRACAPRRKK
jgi:hypothetical protein